MIQYICDKDEIILEDELQRIKLLEKKDDKNAKFRVSNLPNGVVCGVYGREISGGKFEVEDIVFPTPFGNEKEATNSNSSKEGGEFVLMSGLELSSANDPMPLELALSWLVGEAGEMNDQKENSKVERVILAGNSLGETTRDRDVMSKARYLTKDRDASSLEAVCKLDEVLLQLADSVDVDLMPGPKDPANQIMPQQPLHHCLFPSKIIWHSCSTGDSLKLITHC